METRGRASSTTSKILHMGVVQEISERGVEHTQSLIGGKWVWSTIEGKVET